MGRVVTDREKGGRSRAILLGLLPLTRRIALQSKSSRPSTAALTGQIRVTDAETPSTAMPWRPSNTRILASQFSIASGGNDAQ